MTARICQYAIAAVFLLLDSWALIAPRSVIDLAVTEAYREDTYLTGFVMAGFGSQAVLFGAVALVERWTADAFALFALLLLPFFAFNWYFHYEVPVLTSIGMLDFAGNVTMFAAALIGWKAAHKRERTPA